MVQERRYGPRLVHGTDDDDGVVCQALMSALYYPSPCTDVEEIVVVNP